MVMERHAAAVALVVASGGALVGCPPLSAIDVGEGDAGTRSDARGADATDSSSEESCSSNVDSDPKNCGRCGHDCMGGTCRAGACQPYAIVPCVDSPYAVAVQNGNVYFTTLLLTVYEWCGGGVDCAFGTLNQLTTCQGGPRGITTDETNVYWADLGFPDGDASGPGSISTCGLAGCAGGAATVYAPSENGAFDLVVDPSAVYWTDTYSGLVRKCAIGGCGDDPVTLATDSPPLSGVAIDTTSIYWAEVASGNIIQCPLDGCTTFAPFATGQASPAKIDTANGNVYWSAAGAIMTCPASGCGGAARVFAKDQPGAFAITHDSNNLYWTLLAKDGMVLSCPLAGCTEPTVLGAMQDSPTSVAQDDVSVYWANSRGNAVMRVMK
jgi:hypothetical protein